MGMNGRFFPNGWLPFHIYIYLSINYRSGLRVVEEMEKVKKTLRSQKRLGGASLGGSWACTRNLVPHGVENRSNFMDSGASRASENGLKTHLKSRSQKS